MNKSGLFKGFPFQILIVHGAQINHETGQRDNYYISRIATQQRHTILFISEIIVLTEFAWEVIVHLICEKHSVNESHSRNYEHELKHDFADLVIFPIWQQIR